MCEITYAGTVGFQATVDKDSASFSNFIDGSDKYRWQLKSGRTKLSKIYLEIDGGADQLFQISLNQRRSKHTGAVGRYRCMFMCAWFTEQDIDPGKPYYSIEYSIDSISSEWVDGLHWGPFKAVLVSLTPRVSVHSISAQFHGETSYSYRRYIPTFGMGASIDVHPASLLNIRFARHIDGIVSSEFKIASQESELAAEYLFAQNWSARIAFKYASVKLGEKINPYSRASEKWHDVSFGLAYHW